MKIGKIKKKNILMIPTHMLDIQHYWDDNEIARRSHFEHPKKEIKRSVDETR